MKYLFLRCKQKYIKISNIKDIKEIVNNYICTLYTNEFLMYTNTFSSTFAIVECAVFTIQVQMIYNTSTYYMYYVLVVSKVLILDCNSEIGAHVCGVKIV